MKNDSLVEKKVNVWFNERQMSKIYNIDIETLRRHRYSKPKRGFPYHIIGRTNKTNGYIRYNKYEIEKYLLGDITSPKM